VVPEFSIKERVDLSSREHQPSVSRHSKSGPFSPDVRLWIEQGERIVPLHQVAPDWVMPKSGEDLRPGAAVVVSEIDGRRFCRPVDVLGCVPGWPELRRVRGRAPATRDNDATAVRRLRRS